MNKQYTPIEGRTRSATRIWIVAASLCASFILASTASSETPSNEEIIAEANARVAQRHQISEQAEERFASRLRSSNQDAAAEARLGEAISAGLKSHDSRTSVESVECRESLCKARIQMGKQSDRGAVMFALLSTNQCGVTVPDADDEDSKSTLVAFLDCTGRQ